MATSKQTAVVRTEVVREPTVMSGEPVVRGTRILARTILNYLRSGYCAEEIFRDYQAYPSTASTQSNDGRTQPMGRTGSRPKHLAAKGLPCIQKYNPIQRD